MVEFGHDIIPKPIVETAKKANSITGAAKNLVDSVVSLIKTSDPETTTVHNLNLPVDTDVNHDMTGPEELAKELADFVSAKATGEPNAIYNVTSRVTVPEDITDDRGLVIESGLGILADEIRKKAMLTKNVPPFVGVTVFEVCPVRRRGKAISEFVTRTSMDVQLELLQQHALSPDTPNPSQ